jgi:hypothetical protein
VVGSRIARPRAQPAPPKQLMVSLRRSHPLLVSRTRWLARRGPTHHGQRAPAAAAGFNRCSCLRSSSYRRLRARAQLPSKPIDAIAGPDWNTSRRLPLCEHAQRGVVSRDDQWSPELRPMRCAATTGSSASSCGAGGHDGGGAAARCGARRARGEEDEEQIRGGAGVQQSSQVTHFVL